MLQRLKRLPPAGAGDGPGRRAPGRGRSPGRRRRARRARPARPPRRRSRRSAAPTCSTRDGGPARLSCTRSCCRRSTHDLPAPTRAARATRRARAAAHAARRRAGGGRRRSSLARRRAATRGWSSALRAAAARALVARRSRSAAAAYLERALAEPPAEQRAAVPTPSSRGAEASRRAARGAVAALPRGDARSRPSRAERGQRGARARPLPEVRAGTPRGDRRRCAPRSPSSATRTPTLAEELEVELRRLRLHLARRAAAARRRDRGDRRRRDRRATPLDRLHLIGGRVRGRHALRQPAERAAGARAARSRPGRTPAADGGHMYMTARDGAACGRERFEEARAPATTERSTRPAGAARAPASRRARACARCCTTGSGGSPTPRPTPTAALDLRDEVQGAQALPRAARSTRSCSPRLDRGTADPELLALADDFFGHAAVRRSAVQPGDGRARLAAGGARAISKAGSPRCWPAAARAASWDVGTPADPRVALDGGARSCLRLGRLEQARELAGAGARAGAARSATPRALGVALRAAALAEAGARRIALLREAGAVLERSPGRAGARPRADRPRRGAGARRAKRDEARERAARTGRSGAAAAGAMPLVERAHRELRRDRARGRGAPPWWGATG